MRRAALVMLAITVVASPASAADWDRAGGGLFVRPADAAGAAKPQLAGAPVDRVASPVQPYADAIAEAAAAHGLDPKLLHALVIVESGYRSRAVSHAGAAGLTQLMPATATSSSVDDAFDPAQSLRGGAGYLAAQINRFGDLRLALAAYNAGPDRVAKLGRVPDLLETKAYVAAVIDCYLVLSAGRSVRAARECQK